MKLVRKLPDKPGAWWCWHEGMKKTVVEQLRPDMYGNILRGNDSGNVWSFLDKQYTHFAGPIPMPDLPEPEKVELTGTMTKIVYPMPDCFDRHPEGFHCEFWTENEPSQSFMGAKLKITLEKLGDE